MLIARGIPKARLEMRIDEMAIFGAGNKSYLSNMWIKVNVMKSVFSPFSPGFVAL